MGGALLRPERYPTGARLKQAPFGRVRIFSQFPVTFSIFTPVVRLGNCRTKTPDGLCSAGFCAHFGISVCYATEPDRQGFGASNGLGNTVRKRTPRLLAWGRAPNTKM